MSSGIFFPPNKSKIAIAMIIQEPPLGIPIKVIFNVFILINFDIQIYKKRFYH